MFDVYRAIEGGFIRLGDTTETLTSDMLVRGRYSSSCSSNVRLLTQKCGKTYTWYPGQMKKHAHFAGKHLRWYDRLFICLCVISLHNHHTDHGKEICAQDGLLRSPASSHLACSIAVLTYESMCLVESYRLYIAEAGSARVLLYVSTGCHLEKAHGRCPHY